RSSDLLLGRQLSQLVQRAPQLERARLLQVFQLHVKGRSQRLTEGVLMFQRGEVHPPRDALLCLHNRVPSDHGDVRCLLMIRVLRGDWRYYFAVSVRSPPAPAAA